MQVGVKANDKQWARGNQYQYCVKTSVPTTACKLVWPVRDWRPNVTLRPPPSMMPWAKIAPNFAIVSSCLLLMTCEYNWRKNVTFGHVWSVCWIRIIADAIWECKKMERKLEFKSLRGTMNKLTSAPWRTKLTGSNFAIGSNNAIASRNPVPAQAIPNAIAAP